MGRLDRRVAVVTGAGRGIGAEVARLLAREGAHVVVNDLGVEVDGTGVDKGPAQSVVDEITEAGGTAVADHGDVADFDSAGSIVQTALDSFGRLDVLVNVAGILRDRMIVNMTPQEWEAVIQVHLTGTFNTTRHAAAHWKERRGEGGYRLINFTSGAGLFGAPGQPNYAAAKMGIVGLTLSCANALTRYGVTSNAVAPAAATRMTGTIPPERAAELGIDMEKDLAPGAVAYPVAYLASEESGWLNGRVVGCRGGRISLYANPCVEREIVSTQAWDVDTVFREMPRAFDPARQGLAGLV
jgi:NAD(P)-dependent dehydrogenase (short-subunit alcohol dehydrogenase family)